MGLDMYLYTSSRAACRDAQSEMDDWNREFYTESGSNVALYWRKANHIHKWFVENVQNDEDDCGFYWVDAEQLEKLLSICEEVLADHSKAPKLLPTTEGFFFGGQDYGDWYFEDVEYTERALSALLANLIRNGWTVKHKSEPDWRCHFYYHSSW